jgi:hypothetical protein
VADVVATMAGARARWGDTFAVDSGGTEYLFCFSPAGVRTFYALPEADASKGVADWQMLLRAVLLDHYELHAAFTTAEPLPGQIGGVARSAAPCPVRYAVRA